MTFARPTYKRERVYPTPIPLNLRSNATMARADGFAATVEKENLLQHAGYMDLVRAMPCAHCGAPPRSQFCHSDEGKGTSIKTDCRRGWPGCAECHHLVGTQRYYGKFERRALEAEMSSKTRAQIESSGLWPKTLPRWES